jgi:hypothetical protein
MQEPFQRCYDEKSLNGVQLPFLVDVLEVGLRAEGGSETRSEQNENEKKMVDMMRKMVLSLSSKNLCNERQKVELTKKRVGKSSCWTKKMA